MFHFLLVLACNEAAETEGVDEVPETLIEEPGAPNLDAPADVAAAPADAQTTPTGLAYKVMTKGTGTTHPNSWDTVKVHYTGWQSSDGNRFDSSVERDEPAEFPLSGVIKGWTEGLQLMVVGEKTRFWIPAELAYGNTPMRPGGPSGMLVFDVELLEITPGVQPPDAPEDVAAAGEGSTTEASGLAWKQLKKGDGVKADAWDLITIEFSVWQTDGTYLDSSRVKGKPLTAPLGELMPGWQEGIGMMQVGEERRFWIPPELATLPGRPPPPSALVFDIELTAVTERAAPPEVPSDLSPVPSTAKTTESGLAYRVLNKGTGTAHPAATSKVTVHYSGWTLDGQMFDSSVTRGQPSSFGLDGVIKGWTEGVQYMVVGEKTRFWIPADLAYGDTPMRPGGPSGMLVFDVELVSIDSE
jgi:FKBP-type peptidyl-prolyl cis-trans isomerase